MSNIDINQYKPRREGEYLEFTSSENRCTHIGRNPKQDHIRQFKVDGEVLKAGTPEQRCDYLLLNDTRRKAYYIELKGSDIPKAIEQIENTILLLSSSITKYQSFPRIVYRTGSHKIQDSKVLKWRKKYGERAKIESRFYAETL